MKNYFVLNQDLTKIQAIDALATILQDESLQLTGEMEKVGLSAWKRCFLVRDYENGNTYGYNDSDGYHFENLEQVLDNFEDFHQSCFLDDLDTKCDDGTVEFGDYDAAVAYLLTSKEFRQILRNIKPEAWPYPTGITAEINQQKNGTKKVMQLFTDRIRNIFLFSIRTVCRIISGF